MIKVLIYDLEIIRTKKIFKKCIHQKLAIIDRWTVWYGSINLLTYGKSKESFKNTDITEDLLVNLEKYILNLKQNNDHMLF